MQLIEMGRPILSKQQCVIGWDPRLNEKEKMG